MQETSLKDKTAKGLLWGILNNGTMQLLNALFGIVISRKVTVEEYGLVGMLTIFSTIAAALQESGFISALTNRRNATQADYNSVFWFNITCSFAIYVLLWFAAPLIVIFFHEPRLLWLSRYAFIGFFIASFSITPRAILFKTIRAREQAIMQVVSLLLSGIVGMALVLCGFAHWGIATQSIIYVACVSVFSWHFSHFRPSFNISFQPVREMFGFSAKMLATRIFETINNNIFSIFLGNRYHANEVGMYNQANKWNLMGSQTITGMIQGVAQPMFVQVTDNAERQQRVFRKMLRFTSFVAFPAMFGVALIAPDIIPLLIGDKWQDSANLMRMLCIAGAFLPIANLYYNFIISRGKSNIYMWNTIAQGLVILALLCAVNLFQLQFMGLSGIWLMVSLYVCVIILWTLIWHFFLWREIHLPILHALLDIVPFMLIAALTMFVSHALTCTITNIYLLLAARIIVAALIYLGSLRLLHANILTESINYILKRKNK